MFCKNYIWQDQIWEKKLSGTADMLQNQTLIVLAKNAFFDALKMRF